MKSSRVSPYGGYHLSKDIEGFLLGKMGRFPHNKYQLSEQKYTSSFLDYHQMQLLSDIK